MPSDALQRLADLEEIRQLKARYFRCVDTKDWEGFGGCFTDDVHFEAGGVVRDGRSDLVGALSKALATTVTFHQGHTAEITVDAPDTATGVWSFSSIVRRPGDPQSDVGHGHYHERYARTAYGWRIQSSIVTRIAFDGGDEAT